MISAYLEEIISALWIIAAICLGIIAIITEDRWWLLISFGLCVHGLIGFISAMKAYKQARRYMVLRNQAINKEYERSKENGSPK